MFDIVLFSGVSRLAFDIKPIGMYKIASILRANDYRVKTIDMFSSMSLRQFKLIVDTYISESTIIIGISASVLKDYQTNDYFGIPLIELVERFDYIREKNPDIKFIVGGAQISNTLDGDNDTFNMFDYIVKGQGEESVLHIANHIKNGSKLITTTLSKPYIVSEQSYPYKNFKLVGNTFHEDDNIQIGECLPIEIARGCIFKCKFCSYDLTNKNFDEFTRQEDLIRSEFLYNYSKFKTTNYIIVDDLINDSEEKVDMLLRVTQSLPFKVYLSGYIRLDMLWRFPSMIDKLKDIGLVGAFMGIETINDPSGKAVGKGLGKKRINETLDLLYLKWNNTVHITAGFILGLPKDDKTTATDLIEWCRDKLKTKRLHCVHASPLNLHPELNKADIDKNPEKYGYTILDSPVDNVRHRYTMAPSNWSTEHYDFVSASADMERFYAELSSLYLPTINTFNITNIRSLNSLLYEKIKNGETESNIIHELTDYYLNSRQMYIQSLIDNIAK